MPARRIIVIGGSAGSIETLVRVLAELPPDLPAAVFVVIHISPLGNSKLPEVIGKRIRLTCAFAQHNDEPIQPGHIYVAPPDWHVHVRPGRIELSHGPKENHTRPAIDPTFRTAAFSYGAQVIGVVLSGGLGDGAAGAAIIKAGGGTVIVQDPGEALYDSMPRTAIRYLEDVDYIVPSTQIAPLLVQLTKQAEEPAARQSIPFKGEQKMDETMNNMEAAASSVIRRDIDAQAHNERTNALTIYTCPDCGGTLWQIEQGLLTRYLCHVGHAWSPEVVLALKSEELEATLWTAARLLTEKATMNRQFADEMRKAGDMEQAERIKQQAELDGRHLRIIREQLLEGTPNPTAQAAVVNEALEAHQRKSK